MKREGSLLWIAALLLATTACATVDETKSAAAKSVLQSGAVASVPVAQPVAVTVLGARRADSINLFPADFGSAPLVNGRERAVPQERGQDKRPIELVPPVPDTANNFATLPAGTLVLYDSTGQYGWLGELYAIAALNLASHFGVTASKPVIKYAVGDIAKYKAVIYIGSTYDEPLPVAFLDDVLATNVPVIWMYDNIWQLANRATDFNGTYGFNPWAFDVTPIASVIYKDTTLTRDASNGGGVMQFSPFDATKVTTLATAVRADATTLPWAIRSGNLTYLGEVPFAYIGHDDRYLAYCDLLFDALAPTAATQHRALVRLEDVDPMTDPTGFKAIVDYLYSQKVPFSIALIPLYTDPLGALNGGKAQTVKWTQKPAMVTQIKYATSKGGTLVLHGYTHQYGAQANPYTGTTGDDFEFFLAHVDADSQDVIYDGPVAKDSATWAKGRITSGLAALKTAGFATPTLFEYPHYAGSSVDSKAIKTLLGSAYHRGLYFGGDLGLTPADSSHRIGMFYPYTVTDIYGWKIKPENLGNYEPDPYNNHPARLPADLILTAQKNLIVRDGVASFFFHPYNPLAQLKEIVTGVKASGYTFVSVNSL